MYLFICFDSYPCSNFLIPQKIPWPMQKKNTFKLIKPIKDSLKSNYYSLKKVQTLLIFHSNYKTNFTDQMISQTQYCMHLQTSEHISQLSNPFTSCMETYILVQIKTFQHHLPNSTVQKYLSSINEFCNQLKLQIFINL